MGLIKWFLNWTSDLLSKNTATSHILKVRILINGDLEAYGTVQLDPTHIVYGVVPVRSDYKILRNGTAKLQKNTLAYFELRKGHHVVWGSGKFGYDPYPRLAEDSLVLVNKTLKTVYPDVR